MPKNTRLAGHTLRSEGMPFVWADWGEGYDWRQPSNWTGKGICSCGATSEMLESNNQRKQWHAAHKAAVRAGMSKQPPTADLTEAVRLIESAYREALLWAHIPRQAAEERMGIPAGDERALDDPGYDRVLAWCSLLDALRKQAAAVLAGAPKETPDA